MSVFGRENIWSSSPESWHFLHPITLFAHYSWSPSPLLTYPSQLPAGGGHLPAGSQGMEIRQPPGILAPNSALHLLFWALLLKCYHFYFRYHCFLRQTPFITTDKSALEFKMPACTPPPHSSPFTSICYTLLTLYIRHANQKSSAPRWNNNYFPGILTLRES